MTDPTKIAIKASTQEHLEIEDILEGVVILKNGSSCLIIGTTAINFGLLSEKEQEATIFAYAALLNSLTFPIQIFIRSTRKDITSYLALLAEREAKEKRQLMKEQITKYKEFIQKTVQKNNVLDKKFFLIIPMNALELGLNKGSIQKNLPPLLAFSPFGKKKKQAPVLDKEYIVQQAKINLYPKRDHLLRQLSRLGLKAHQLSNHELVRLFYDIYNPESAGQQMADVSQYQTPMVKAVFRTQEGEEKPKETQPKKKINNIQNQISDLVNHGNTVPKKG